MLSIFLGCFVWTWARKGGRKIKYQKTMNKLQFDLLLWHILYIKCHMNISKNEKTLCLCFRLRFLSLQQQSWEVFMFSAPGKKKSFKVCLEFMFKSYMFSSSSSTNTIILLIILMKAEHFKILYKFQSDFMHCSLRLDPDEHQLATFKTKHAPAHTWLV